MRNWKQQLGERQASFASLVEVEYLRREAKSEKASCLVWFLVIFLTYSLFLGFAPKVSEDLFHDITLLVAVMAPSFALLALIIHLGYYSPYLRFLNTFLQITLVSGAIFADTISQGPEYALSSMPPMAYGLVAAITAFRLQPWLGVFAGVVAGLEFLLLYLFIISPSDELIERVPSLALDVTLMKVVILVALGVVCGFAARRLKNYLNTSVHDALQISSLEKTFGRFVSRDVAQRILTSDAQALAPRETDAVIVFGDIRGFTAFSSESLPSEVAGLLNRYFEVVCRIVEEEGGVLNKFLGDGYLALFGLFSDEGNPHDAAARAVFRIQHETEPLLKPHGLGNGAAAHAGRVITGEIGSEGRCEFTAIGSAVNLTARLEKLNAELDTYFVATQDFSQALSPGIAQASSLGKHGFKGVPFPIEIVYLTEPGSGQPKPVEAVETASQ